MVVVCGKMCGKICGKRCGKIEKIVRSRKIIGVVVDMDPVIMIVVTK